MVSLPISVLHGHFHGVCNAAWLHPLFDRPDVGEGLEAARGFCRIWCLEAEDAFPPAFQARSGPRRTGVAFLLLSSPKTRTKALDSQRGEGQDQSPPVPFPVVSEACSPFYKAIMKGGHARRRVVTRQGLPQAGGEQNFWWLSMLEVRWKHAPRMSALPMQPEVHACVRFDFGRAHETGGAPHQRIFFTQ